MKYVFQTRNESAAIRMVQLLKQYRTMALHEGVNIKYAIEFDIYQNAKITIKVKKAWYEEHLMQYTRDLVQLHKHKQLSLNGKLSEE